MTFNFNVDSITPEAPKQNEKNNNVLHEYFQIMPAMTSNSAPSGYRASSSGDFSGYSPYKAFSKAIDMNCSQRWLSANATEWSPQWIAIQLPEAKQISAYSIFFVYKGGVAGEEGRNPKSWRLEGKNSSGEWTTIDTRENEPQSTYYHDIRTYVLNEKVSYSNYRLYITEAQQPESTYGHGVHILMLELLDK